MSRTKRAMILGKDIYFSLDDYYTKLNNNVLIVGTSGAGKTMNVISPNLDQCAGSYIVSDPKGCLYDRFKDKLTLKGYTVKRLDFYHPEKSTHGFNFFAYLKTEQDVIKLADMLVYAENGRFSGTIDPFWDQAGQLLLQSIIAYLWNYQQPCDQTLEMINRFVSKIRVPDENDLLTIDQSGLGELMLSLPETAFARKSYEKFATAASRTLRGVLVTLTAHIGRWDIDAINELTKRDYMQLDKVGEEKTAIFVTTSDTDRSMDGLIDIFFEQALVELCRHADIKNVNQRLSVPVRFILDDFSNTSYIKSIPTAIAGVRSRGISFMLCIQAESQLSRMYKEDASTIIGCCDTYLYMGGNDLETAKRISERCNLPLKRILEMPVGYSWLFRRGEKPKYIQNYDYLGREKHKEAVDKNAG